MGCSSSRVLPAIDINDRPRSAHDQATSTTELKEHEEQQNKPPKVVYRKKRAKKGVNRDRIVHNPQYSDIDLVVISAKSLDHTLRENFQAEGRALGDLLFSASRKHRLLKERLWKPMLNIVQQRNRIIHQAAVQRFSDRKRFVRLITSVWTELEKNPRCEPDCTVCTHTSQFIENLMERDEVVQMA